jgi:branched-chain amino acid aminotransferase
MSSTGSDVLKADKVWMDGKLIPWAEANVHVMTHALHYGLGVFEGIRAYKTKDGRLAIFRLREHIRRFMDSAHIIMLNLPYTEEALMEACLSVLREQRERFANGAYLRPIAFMGDGAMGLGAVNPTRVAITAWDWGAYLGEKGVRDGIRAKVSSFTRMHVNVNMVRGKISGQYVNSILAKREAVLGGYDEAILLDISGFVAEASGENIFCVGRHGVVRTPSLSSPILRGITRDTVLTLLQDMGREVQEVSFTRDALYIAAEVFFTGTAAEVTPVREVDNRTVGEGKPGPITQAVQEQYFRLVRGYEPKYADWLTYV